jgi:hypothetical protein
MPYIAEKFNHKRALQGKLKRDGDFDDNAPSWRFKQVSHGYISVKRLTSSKSYTSTLTTSRSKDVTQEKVIKQTRLNTRLTTALNGVFEGVYLEDALTVEALFAEVIQAWQSKIKERKEGSHIECRQCPCDNRMR